MDTIIDYDVDKMRHKVDLLVDEFILLIKTMIDSTTDKEGLYNKIAIATNQRDANRIISEVRFLSSLTTDPTLRLNLEFEELFKKGYLSPAELSLFAERVNHIVSDQVNFSNLTTKRPSAISEIPWDKCLLVIDEERRNMAVLSLQIDGKWSIEDFNDFFSYLQYVYRSLLNIHVLNQHHLVGHTYEYLNGLKVVEIRYSSPGNIDLLGIGKVFEQLVVMINKVIHWKQSLQVEKYKMVNEQIETLKSIYTNINQLNLDDKTLQEAEKTLKKAAEDTLYWLDPQKVTGAKIIPLNPIKKVEDYLDPINFE